MDDDKSKAGFLVVLALCAGCAVPSSPSIAQTAIADAANLRDEVRRNGSVRVVVTLAIAGSNPADPEAIHAAQDRLLAALASTRYENLHRFRNLPQVAMTAQRDALEVLLASPLVAAVAADSLSGSMSPGLSR